MDFFFGSEKSSLGRSVLAVPSPREAQRFFQGEAFRRFLAQVERCPGVERSLQFGRATAGGSSATYRPGAEFGSTRYSELSHADAAPSCSGNSVWRRLEKKRRQIRKVNFEGPVGIVLCDAGHSLFARSSLDTVNLSTIVSLFLERSPEVSFILVLRTRERDGRPRVDRRPAVEIYWNLRAQVRCPDWADKELHRLEDLLPVLERDSVNARVYIEFFQGKHGKSRRGLRVSVGRDRYVVEVPAQSLLAALSDPRLLERQIAAWRPSTKPSRTVSSPFEAPLRRGMKLVLVELVQLHDEDEDLLRFTFEGKDAAIGPIEPDGHESTS